MAEDFPDDSYFRNSNVALLDAVVNTKACDILVANVPLGEDINVSSITSEEAVPECKILSPTKLTTAFQLLNSAVQISSNTSFKSSSAIRVATETSNSEQSPQEESLVDECSDSERVTDSKLGRDPALTSQQPKPKGKRGNSSKSSCVDPPACKTGKTKQEIKDQKKNEYRPLNITRSVLQISAKHPSGDDILPDPELHNVSEQKVSRGGESKSSFVKKQDSPLQPESRSLLECSDISVLSPQQKLKLDVWGLPPKILKQYEKRGIKSMFPWQVECLCSPRVLVGGNLVYSAPTSAGKTLVSEILCIKTVLEKRKKALFILPFVSVVREKMFYFQELLGSSGIRVDGYMGGHGSAGGFRCVDLAVCTIEKANSLINRLMEENTLSSLGAVVVDELHLLGDSHRGYLLELLLTKLKYMSSRDSDVSVQLIGMSATLPNLSLLSAWLGAELYKTTFRPIPLEEYIKVGNVVYSHNMKIVRTISPEIHIKGDNENIIYLCLETIAGGHSVLIFCPTKNRCESLAQTIAAEFRTIGQNRDPNAPDSLPFKLREQLNANAISQALELLRRCPVGLDRILAKTVSFGVAFHHAGLTMDERDIVEGSFRNGTLRVIVATSTLSSGVNLPARRVIVRSPVFHGQPIDILTYRQMIGRAGRMGVDTAGESFLVCQKSEQRIAESLVQSQLKPIKSCLGLGSLSASLKRAILEVIASGVATTPTDVELYTDCTLLAASCKESGSESFLCSDTSTNSAEAENNPVLSCVNFLKDSEFIRLQVGEDGVTHFVPTPLGQACLSASLPPDEGLMLFSELQRARQCFVLENELHIIYQVTPFNVSEQWGNLDWLQVLALWEQLPSDMKRVGELVGVEDRFIVRAMRGTINFKSDKQRHKLMVHRRFYTALALNDLVNEVPLNTVANKFNCTRGMLQSLQQSASTYAGMVTSFCRRLGWSSVELLVEQFQDRLHFGTQRELLDLLRLPSLNGPRARALYNLGITTLAELTTADVLVVENALCRAVPFESEKEREGETTHETERRRKLRGVWVTGRQGLSEQEAAELIISEARSVIMRELGLTNVNWEEAQARLQTGEKNDNIDEMRKEKTCTPRTLSSGTVSGSIDGEDSSCSVLQNNGNDLQGLNSSTDFSTTLKGKFKNQDHPIKVSDKSEVMQEAMEFKSKQVIQPEQNTDQESLKLKSSNSMKERSLTKLSEIELSPHAERKGRHESERAFKLSTSQGTGPASSISNESQVISSSSETENLKSRSSYKNHEETKTSDSSLQTGESNSPDKLVKAVRKTTDNSESMDCFASTYSDQRVNTFIETSPLLRRESASENKARRGSLEMSFDSPSPSNPAFTKPAGNVMVSQKEISKNDKYNHARDQIAESSITNSLAVYFDSDSFSTTTFDKIYNPQASEQEAPCTDTNRSEIFSKKNKKNRLNESQARRRNSFDHLFMSTLSESAFAQSGVEKEGALIAPVNSQNSVKRLVSDFSLVNTQEQKRRSWSSTNSKSTATSGLGNTYFSPSLSNVLKRSNRDRKKNTSQKTNGGNATKCTQDESPISPKFVRSPSLFGDSFELNSNLCNVLDMQLQGNDLETMYGDELESEVIFKEENTSETSIYGAKCSKILVGNENSNPHDKAHTQSFCEKLNICSVLTTVSGGMKNKTRRGVYFSVSDPAKSIPNQSHIRDLCGSPVDDTLIKNERDGNKWASQESPVATSHSSGLQGRDRECSSTVKELKSDVLTDSFMEVAFQSAFDSETSATTKRTLSYDIEEESNDVEKFTNPPKSEFVKEKGYNVPTCSVRKRSIVTTSPDEEPTRGISSESPCKRRRLFKNEDFWGEDDDILQSSQETVAIQCKTTRRSPKHIATADKCPMRKAVQKTEEGKSRAGGDKGSSVMLIEPPQSEYALRQRLVQSRKLQQDLDTAQSVASSCSISKQKEDGEDCKTHHLSSVKQDWSMFNIIDVCGDSDLFKAFSKAITSADALSFSLACEREVEVRVSHGGIGTRMVRGLHSLRKSSLAVHGTSPMVHNQCRLIGVAFCLGRVDAYYISLQKDEEKNSVPLKDRLHLLHDLFSKCSGNMSREVLCFDMKEQYKALYRCSGIAMNIGSACDPKIADWLLEPEGKEKNLQAMVVKYLESATDLAEHAGNVRGGVGSPALDLEQTIPGRKRSCVEAILCWHLIAVQKTMLHEAQLLKFFRDVEMPVVLILARMELNGIGFSCETAEALREKLVKEMSTLEERAYQLAGRAFSLTSPADTARVVYQELRLGVGSIPGRGSVSRGRGSSKKGGTRSTSKEALNKLRSEHPLPGIILLWRKMNAIVTKIVYPLLKPQECTRMYGSSISHTATGRITMHEPNLQNIPRDFDISPDVHQNFSMRGAFIPFPGNILIAADYSQLELRLLAHLADDHTLRSILNSGQDVFCSIAASWKKIPLEQVTDVLRQRAKQICYGMIYGMGPPALAEQLDVDQSEAAIFLESFQNAYPNVRQFLTNTVDRCRNQGYVETILGRRRYLPNITSANANVRAHAERQAVNTTVQGSAADLAKTAMVAVDKALRTTFPNEPLVLQHTDKPHCSSESTVYSQRGTGPNLVLHLHDELIYEVSRNEVRRVSQILRSAMESAIQLSVKLPVKVRTGESWGALEELFVDSL